jgi:hypothetical protein
MSGISRDYRSEIKAGQFFSFFIIELFIFFFKSRAIII